MTTDAFIRETTTKASHTASAQRETHGRTL